jgi:nicotinamidase/pyrazinamidase
VKTSVCVGKVHLRQNPAGSPALVLNHGDALIIVDVQRDFLQCGSLEVPGGEDILPVVNRYQAMFVPRNLPIFLSGDWHPRNHCSFQAQGGPWPPHCVVNTPGAAFPRSLTLPESATVIRKGCEVNRDAYSAFDGTDLAARLQGLQILRVFVGGLATDYSVLHTTRDALRLGFETFLLKDAIRAVNAHPDDGQRAEAEMIAGGATPIQLEDLIHAQRR